MKDAAGGLIKQIGLRANSYLDTYLYYMLYKHDEPITFDFFVYINKNVGYVVLHRTHGLVCLFYDTVFLKFSRAPQ